MNASPLLDESTVIPYLRNRLIISQEESPLIEILTGGISNVVFGVSTGEKDMVLKQALPELIVPSTWRADQRRTIVEGKALQVLHDLTPNNVPVLIDVDAEHFILIMQRASRGMHVWKDDLLDSHIDIRVAQNLGFLLGRWHRATSESAEILSEFVEDQLFDQLRITPFYREIANVHPDISNRVQQLIAELEFSRKSLVHGDFSPKNILVSETGDVTVLDFEVAHTGNPVFDPAFLLAHLFCKSVHFSNGPEKSQLKKVALKFLSSYEEALGAKGDSKLGWHVATIALSRVDGVSKVHYLSSASIEAVRSKTLEMLSKDTSPTVEEIFS